MKHFLIVLACLAITTVACNNETDTDGNEIGSDAKSEVQIDKEKLLKGESAIKVADSIMYITTVINPNPAEDYYMKDWLGGADIQSLAELLFKAVYADKLKAYDYLTGDELTMEEVKAIDEEFKREDIGQILFTEDWYFDEKDMKMYKQVNSVMMAYYRYADDGTIMGNKAGIRVYFNETKPMRGAIDY
jgi:hypothetical protein